MSNGRTLLELIEELRLALKAQEVRIDYLEVRLATLESEYLPIGYHNPPVPNDFKYPASPDSPMFSMKPEPGSSSG